LISVLSCYDITFQLLTLVIQIVYSVMGSVYFLLLALH